MASAACLLEDSAGNSGTLRYTPVLAVEELVRPSVQQANYSSRFQLWALEVNQRSEHTSKGVIACLTRQVSSLWLSAACRNMRKGC